MDTKKDNHQIEMAAGIAEQPDSEQPLACPFCATALSLLKEDDVAAKYACVNHTCMVGYSRHIFKPVGGSIRGFETAHHAAKDALVQVVDYGWCSSVYTRQSGDDEGSSCLLPGVRCTLKDVFEDIEHWLPS